MEEKYGDWRLKSAPVRVDHPADRGHRYFFTVPELPWKREKPETPAQEEDNGS